MASAVAFVAAFFELPVRLYSFPFPRITVKPHIGAAEVLVGGYNAWLERMSCNLVRETTVMEMTVTVREV